MTVHYLKSINSLDFESIAAGQRSGNDLDHRAFTHINHNITTDNIVHFVSAQTKSGVAVQTESAELDSPLLTEAENAAYQQAFGFQKAFLQNNKDKLAIEIAENRKLTEKIKAQNERINKGWNL